MAIKGLSKFIVCDGYEADAATNKISYSADPVATEKLVSYSVEPEITDNNPLYGDNGVAEMAGGQFTSGTLTVSTTEQTDATSKAVLTVKEVTQTVGSKQVTGLVYEKDTCGKTVGVGLIEEHQHQNKDFYRAVILPKVRFDIPSTEAETRGDKIDWKTPEFSGTIMASDEVDDDRINGWKECYDCDSEKAAVDLINAWFGERKASAKA